MPLFRGERRERKGHRRDWLEVPFLFSSSAPRWKLLSRQVKRDIEGGFYLWPVLWGAQSDYLAFLKSCYRRAGSDILQANSRHSTPAGPTSQAALQGAGGGGGVAGWRISQPLAPQRAGSGGDPSACTWMPQGPDRRQPLASRPSPVSPGGPARAAAEGPRPLSAPGRARPAAAELGQLPN